MGPPFARAEYDDRLRRTRAAMRAAGLDVLLVFHQEHMFYLAAYDQIGYWVYQVLIVPADEAPMTAIVRKVDELLVRFDVDEIKDETSSLPHMLPRPEAFAAAVGAMGIGDGMRIVVYDGLGLFSAPRVRWTFQTFGAKDVVILEGGLPQWLAEGRPVREGAPRQRAPRRFLRWSAPRVCRTSAGTR